MRHTRVEPVPIKIQELNALVTPTIAGRPVVEVVRACHDLMIDAGLIKLDEPGLTRDTLEPVLTYCAEQRCVADQASCPGCTRRTTMLGLLTLDDFIASHHEILTETGTRLLGRGTGTLRPPSLDHLAQHWAGSDTWFAARRVLRKLRHGVRSRETPAVAPAGSKPAVILVEPQLADNIGMTARAMANFGLEELRLVAPRDGWPNERARFAASGATFIVEDAVAFPTFNDALADLHWVCATTARQRDLAKPVLTPEQAVAEMRRRIAEGQRVAIVFGRERNGLETSEVARCDAIVMAPVSSTFASLNLAQAVLLVAYEWMKTDPTASLGRVTTYETPRVAGRQDRGFALANKAQLIGLFEQLEDELDHSGFFVPPEKRPTMVQNLRSMLSRLDASEQEVRTLRGIVKALAHGKGRTPKS
jgi:tRNA/rRNA methyltransferase